MTTDNPKLLIDGDTLAYRAAYSCENESTQDAIEKLDDLLYEVFTEVFWSADIDDLEDDYKVFLTGRTNFRNDIAITAPYKGNRKGVEKPQHLSAIRDHMMDNWSATMSEGEEADDLLGIWSTYYGPTSIVASIDKDMLQLPCNHYNPNKKTWLTVDEFGGLKFFYTQILTGDKADNIIGLYGIGPKKADKLLDGVKTECDMYSIVLEAYGGDAERVLENARLLWLRRVEDQLWEAPLCDSDQD